MRGLRGRRHGVAKGVGESRATPFGGQKSAPLNDRPTTRGLGVYYRPTCRLRSYSAGDSRAMATGSTNLLLMLGLRLWLEPLYGAEAYATASVERSVDGIEVVTELQPLLDRATETQLPDEPKWIRHRVRPRERVTQIAARYGVRAEDLIAWNRLDPSKRYPKGRKTLRVRARQIPAPRIEVRYRAQVDETWEDIAAKFRVEQPDLRAWNWERRALQPGRELTVWVDPGAPRTIFPGEGPPQPTSCEVEAGAMSRGRPSDGRLDNGIVLPESELYTRRMPTHGLHGSTHTITQIQRAFASFRQDTGYEGEVVIGAISLRKGGPFGPHLSHQSGRDIDIRLPRLPGVPSTDEPNADEIDWLAAWGLVRAFVDTGEVSMIFLDADLHQFLYEAGRASGESQESVQSVVRWPAWKGEGPPVIRHSNGHDGHIHVRVRCGPDERHCRTR